MPDTRLIERWLPIEALGIESLRERTPMTPFPAPNRLHVWWARRPLVASRAAVLASILPADADRERFKHAIGIHGDPVASRRRIDAARLKGERFEGDAYSYPRAFKYSLDLQDRTWITSLRAANGDPVVLDPTAGGGSIPFEAARLGLPSIANDLNPVATLILEATVTWPSRYAAGLRKTFDDLARRFVAERERRLAGDYPSEPQPHAIPTNYLWARTIRCPYCDGLVPLSPNWRLAPGGIGVRIVPDLAEGPGFPGRVCSFEIVEAATEQSGGTVSRGSGNCPYSDCARVIDGDDIKEQARRGQMGEQLYAVVYKERVEYETKSGRKRWRWVRGFRAPRPDDDNRDGIAVRLAEKLPEWEAFDYVPTERFPEVSNDDRPIQYGMPLWRDLFSPRQLFCHGTSVEVFREMLEADRSTDKLDGTRRAAYGYLAIAINKLINYNARMTRWHANRTVLAGTFDRHDFAFKWSYGEMAPLVTGIGYDWALDQTSKCIKELVTLTNSMGSIGNDLLSQPETPTPVTITCKPGDQLDHVDDASIDVVVMDPPYYDNVMYAELSDFFYVWLKRTAGHVFPELFRRTLTDKESEAVASPAKYRGVKGASTLAGRDYQDRMAAIFAECHRVLKKPDGVMTLMFTHKATGAWDALTTGLIEAGFVITASWPVNTEATGSLHIKDKAAAKSTIFLVCRPREREVTSELRDASPTYWEDVEPLVSRAVRERMAEFQDGGIGGVDLFLASFGPALEQFSRHWPLQRGTPRELPLERRRKQQLELFEETWDPYAATPEDALDAARREVQRWRLEQIAHPKASGNLDPRTAFVVFAWDTFRAPIFPFDEALHLARSVGVDLDRDVVGRLAEKKGGNLRLWDSALRAAKGSLGALDGTRGMIDAIHHAANLARTRSLATARDALAASGVDRESTFFVALEALLEVLPPSPTFTGVETSGDLAAAGGDFEALYNLYRLAFRNEIDEPAQLQLWKDWTGE